MRMWMIHPSLMCSKHLLGEHVETHMLYGNILLNKTLEGYAKKGLIQLKLLKKRHDELADEMQSRSMTHGSPMRDQPDLSNYSYFVQNSYVDLIKSIQELTSRCIDCKKRIDGDKH